MRQKLELLWHNSQVFRDEVAKNKNKTIPKLLAPGPSKHVTLYDAEVVTVTQVPSAGES